MIKKRQKFQSLEENENSNINMLIKNASKKLEIFEQSINNSLEKFKTEAKSILKLFKESEESIKMLVKKKSNNDHYLKNKIGLFENLLIVKAINDLNLTDQAEKLAETCKQNSSNSIEFEINEQLNNVNSDCQRSSKNHKQSKELNNKEEINIITESEENSDNQEEEENSSLIISNSPICTSNKKQLFNKKTKHKLYREIRALEFDKNECIKNKKNSLNIIDSNSNYRKKYFLRRKVNRLKKHNGSNLASPISIDLVSESSTDSENSNNSQSYEEH